MTVLARYGMRILPWGLAIGMGFLPMQALADPDGPPANTVTTQGHGEVKVRPDSLSVMVMVESKADTLAAARNETNSKMQAIISAVKGLNISGLKLETQGVNVYPIHGEPQKNKLPRVIGYQVSNSLNVSVIAAPADKLGEDGSRIVDTALNAGATNVGGLNFFVNDMAPARGKALELAVKDANANAQAMAKAAGIALTGIYNMEGNPQFGGYMPRPMYSMKAMAAAEAAPTPIETGEATVSSDVTIRFKF
jgi:uncharacterized protein YggE